MLKSEIDFCVLMLLSHQQQCAGSICEKYGLEECTCASSDGKDDRELCHVCCMRKSKICLNCKHKYSSRYLRNLLMVFIF